MASGLHDFEQFTFAGQQNTRQFGFPEDRPFPLALKTKLGFNPSVDDAVAALVSLSGTGELFNLIQQHGGALLIRGLPIKTADDYSRIAHAFGLEWHEEVGRPPIRTVLAPNVKTANEGYASSLITVDATAHSFTHPFYIHLLILILNQATGAPNLASQ